MMMRTRDVRKPAGWYLRYSVRGGVGEHEKGPFTTFAEVTEAWVKTAEDEDHRLTSGPTFAENAP